MPVRALRLRLVWPPWMGCACRSLVWLAFCGIGGDCLRPAPLAADPVPTDAIVAWPQFRGPTGQGSASDDQEVPLTWSETENVAWKSRIPGAGWSSPVIEGDEIWLTTATESGRSLRVLSLDRTTGKVTRNIKVFDVDRAGNVHSKNGHASPTPILDGDRVYVHFGANGTACLTRSGRIVWKRTLAYYHHHGSAGSPVLVGGVLVVVCDGFTGPFYDKLVRSGVDFPQFVVGLDAGTGDIRWRTQRKGRHSYGTPLVVTGDRGTQVICPGGDHVWAYDPADGRELWSCRYEGYSVVPRPVESNGVVYVCTGYDTASLLAIRLGGEGDVTSSRVAWRLSQGVPFTPSPVIIGAHIYLLSDNGILSCVTLGGGQVVWKQRLGGNFSASPISVGDRLYCLSEDGVTHVVRVGAQCEKLATNRVKGRTLASLAVAGGRLFLRSDRQLYCIQAGPTVENDPGESESSEEGEAARE